MRTMHSQGRSASLCPVRSMKSGGSLPVGGFIVFVLSNVVLRLPFLCMPVLRIIGLRTTDRSEKPRPEHSHRVNRGVRGKLDLRVCRGSRRHARCRGESFLDRDRAWRKEHRFAKASAPSDLRRRHRARSGDRLRIVGTQMQK